MALIATPGAADANSYATVAQAQAYMDTLLTDASGWSTATTPTKEAALITATRLIDSWFRWLADPTYSDQALGFPRTGLYLNNQVVNPLTIPRQMVEATSEFARELLTVDPATIITDTAAQGIEEAKAGSLSVKFTEIAASDRRLAPIPAYVISLIPSQWYEGGAGAIDNGDETSNVRLIFDMI